MSDFYDRTGKPIPMLEWSALIESADYKIVKQEFTPHKKYWISTVWLGLDHSFMLGAPLIYETMVFSGRRDTWHEIAGKRRYFRNEHYLERYATEAEAAKGHARIVKKWSKK